MRTAGIAIDVRAIRFSIHHISLGAEGIKHRSGNVPSTSVSTIQAHLHALERMYAQRNQVTDVTIAPLHIVNGATNRIFGSVRRNTRLAIQEVLNARNGCIVHLLTIAVDELNTVVVIRIVACRNHDTAIKAVTLRDVGHGGSSRYVQEVSICTRRGYPCREGVFQHVRRATRVLTNYDATATIGGAEIPTEEAPYLEGMFRREPYICFTTKAVCSEIFSHKKKGERRKEKGDPTPNRVQSSLLELPRCEGGKDHEVELKEKEPCGISTQRPFTNFRSRLYNNLNRKEKGKRIVRDFNAQASFSFLLSDFSFIQVVQSSLRGRLRGSQSRGFLPLCNNLGADALQHERHKQAPAP